MQQRENVRIRNEKILSIVRDMLNAERGAVQNAEYNNQRAVEKAQRLADAKMQELEFFLKI